MLCNGTRECGCNVVRERCVSGTMLLNQSGGGLKSCDFAWPQLILRNGGPFR